MSKKSVQFIFQSFGATGQNKSSSRSRGAPFAYFSNITGEMVVFQTVVEDGFVCRGRFSCFAKVNRLLGLDFMVEHILGTFSQGNTSMVPRGVTKRRPY